VLATIAYVEMMPNLAVAELRQRGGQQPAGRDLGVERFGGRHAHLDVAAV